jgi:hypothetical protein
VTNSYGYDALNRLTNVIDQRLSAPTNATGYGFDGVGNLQWVSYPTTGTALTNLYEYNARNGLTNLQGKSPLPLFHGGDEEEGP